MWGTITKKKEALPFYQKRRPTPTETITGLWVFGAASKIPIFCLCIFLEREKNCGFFFVFGERDWRDSAGEGFFLGSVGWKRASIGVFVTLA